MRVVALLAVRNEELYLERCLEHLYRNDIETCLIDNASTDRTLEIANDYRNRGLSRIEHIAFNGIFEWSRILGYKCRLAREIDADWFIHHDADEIREAPERFTTVAEGIEEVDGRGYNAINSDELVFMPTSDEENFEATDYVEKMQYYYYFRPGALHRVNIWKKTVEELDLASTGGHSVTFRGRRIYPENFVLRHYILLSKRHAVAKYGKRRYDPREIARGMNTRRASFDPETLTFPNRDDLKRVSENGQWDLSDPWRRHYFL